MTEIFSDDTADPALVRDLRKWFAWIDGRDTNYSESIAARPLRAECRS